MAGFNKSSILFTFELYTTLSIGFFFFFFGQKGLSFHYISCRLNLLLPWDKSFERMPSGIFTKKKNYKFCCPFSPELVLTNNNTNKMFVLNFPLKIKNWTVTYCTLDRTTVPTLSTHKTRPRNMVRDHLSRVTRTF